jgi:hypothetical protein
VKNKTANDALGARKKCMNFQMCPMCYGCRNYRSNDDACSECASTNKKDNICNTDLHKTDLIAKFITKSRIKLDGDISFKNAK